MCILKKYLRHVSLEVSTIFREQKVSDLKLIDSRPGILGFLKYYIFWEAFRSYVFNILLYIYIYLTLRIWRVQ